MARALGLSDEMLEYVRAVGLREPSVLRALREETSRLPHGGMQLSPDSGQLLRLLAELIGAVNTLEVGVFTGYSSLCVALALLPHGHLVACDISPE